MRNIQGALQVLEGAAIVATELETESYGTSTAAAVLVFKRKRQIINRSYPSSPDNIVGIMTIKAMDEELLAKQREMPPKLRHQCTRRCPCEPRGDRGQFLSSLLSETERTARPDVVAQMRSA